MNKLWFATSMKPYLEDEPGYYKTGDYPWALEIEKNWHIIKEEVNSLIREKEKEFSKVGLLYDQLSPVGKWTNIQFYYWGLKHSSDLKKKCPIFNSLLNKIPGIVSSGITMLDPHSVIPEHRGDTNATIRGHFAIEVPAGLPECGFKVGEEERAWEEGKWLLFNDAYKHSAWNNSEKRRIVMIIDVIRPEFMKKKNLVCAFILARHVSFFYHRSTWMASWSPALKRIPFGIALAGIYIFKPMYNLFKV